MAGKDDLGLQFFGKGQGSIEVADFKPQEHAVSGRDVRIANATMMMLDFPAVQLKHQPALRNEPFILSAAVVAPTARETLIPATAGLNIAHANQGLGSHANFAAYPSHAL